MTSLRMNRAGAVTLLALLLVATAATMPARAQDESAESRRPALVLVHDLGSSAGVWDRVVPFLTENFRVFTYEMPGHGRTATIDHSTIDNVVVHLSAFITENGIERPHLVGHAIGGMIAMQYAFTHPGEVSDLILIDTPPRQLASAEDKATIATQLLENYDSFVANRFLHLSDDPEVADLLADQALRTDSATLITILMDSFDFNMIGELPRHAIPILVVASGLFLPAGDDPLETLMGMGYARAHNLAYKRVGESGHFVMLESPVNLARSITGFAGQPMDY